MKLAELKNEKYIIDEVSLNRFLTKLVQIPSINPPGNEGPVATVISDKLESLGFKVEIVEAAPGRPNVIGRLPGKGEGPTLLLNGHMDVQPPGNHWTHDPFAATLKDGMLYGQGAMDMKAGFTISEFFGNSDRLESM